MVLIIWFWLNVFMFSSCYNQKLRVDSHMIVNSKLGSTGDKIGILFLFLSWCSLHAHCTLLNEPTFLSNMFTSPPMVVLHQEALNTGAFPKPHNPAPKYHPHRKTQLCIHVAL